MEIANIVLEYIRALVWPIIAITGLLLFRNEVSGLIGRIRKVELPGGGAINIGQEIHEAKVISKEVVKQKLKIPIPMLEGKEHIPSIPLTDANARMIELGLRPSPSGLDISYYRNLALENRYAALGGLRLELEILVKNLAKGFKVQIDDRDPALMVLQKLLNANAITSEQLSLAQKVLQICNAAVHGSTISLEETNSVIDLASVLKDQYIRWLSWGFGDTR